LRVAFQQKASIPKEDIQISLPDTIPEPGPVELDCINLVQVPLTALLTTLHTMKQTISSSTPIPKELYDTWAAYWLEIYRIRHLVSSLRMPATLLFVPGKDCLGCDEALTCNTAFNAYNTDGDFLCQK
jgi:hypothetical protein